MSDEKKSEEFTLKDIGHSSYNIFYQYVYFKRPWYFPFIKVRKVVWIGEEIPQEQHTEEYHNSEHEKYHNPKGEQP